MTQSYGWNQQRPQHSQNEMNYVSIEGCVVSVHQHRSVCRYTDTHTTALLISVLCLSVHTCETHYQLTYDSATVSDSSSGCYLVCGTAAPSDVFVEERHSKVILLKSMTDER